MDSKQIRDLMEAYNQIHTSQEVDEAVKGASPHTMQMRKDAAAERRAGIKPLSAKKGEEYAKYKMSQIAYAKRKMGEEVEQVDEATDDPIDVDFKVQRLPNNKTPKPTPQDAAAIAAALKLRARAKSSKKIDEATAMAKRGLDEPAIRQKIAKSTGGGEAADRATKLADRPTFGNANKAQQRQNLARAQRSDFRKTTSSSPGLHGYGHKSDDPAVKAKQAARGAQRGALTPAEKKQLNREEFDIFDIVLEFLQVEGIAETLEEAEWMMANLLDKEEIDIIVEAACECEEEDEEDEKEMKKGKKNKKEEEEEDKDEDIKEATYSAKAARAGKDIGKPGKAFAKIAKSAAKRYGSMERGKKVAGAVLAKLRAKMG